MKIVLFQPLIPQNTGNIVRTCAAFHCPLVLVHPLGFSLSYRRAQRAGLDYWKEVTIEEVEDLDSFLQTSQLPFYFFSSKASTHLSEISIEKEALLIFGNEKEGLPSYLHKKWPAHFLKIPMSQKARCLNLSNSVAIAAYEVARQNPMILASF